MSGVEGGRDGVRALRAAAQMLCRPGGRSAEEVVGRLLAVQAQDPRAARLAVRARSSGLTATGVAEAITGRRTLVVGWLMRGTLHLVRREDYPWLLALTGPRNLAAARRRLAREGVSPAQAERAVAAIGRALGDEGPLTRAELARRLAARGVPSEGQAAAHLVRLACLEGVAVLGPARGGRQALAAARDWLGSGGAPPEPAAALAELARRYLAGHGPAGPADLAVWAGIPLGAARAAFADAAGGLSAAAGGLADLRRRPAGAPSSPPPPRLLPAFDPYLLGWSDRSGVVPERHARRVHPGGGVIRPVATVRGRAVGTWGARRRGGRLDVGLDLFWPLGTEARAGLREEAADVARFEGLAAGGDGAPPHGSAVSGGPRPR